MATLPNRPPLGLPSGSVRAVLTLLVVAVVIAEVVRGREVEPLWSETLMIALAHYFSSRRFINLTPDVVRRLEADGQLEAESNPLYLPRHTIRVVLIVAFVGLAIYLYRQHQLFTSPAISILGVVFAYFLGVLAHAMLVWWTQGRQTPVVHAWEDIKAAVVLLVMIYTAGAYLFDRIDLAPHQLRTTTLGLVLFYFGSR